MNHVSIPKDPEASINLPRDICFNEGMRSPYDPKQHDREAEMIGEYFDIFIGL